MKWIDSLLEVLPRIIDRRVDYDHVTDEPLLLGVGVRLHDAVVLRCEVGHQSRMSSESDVPAGVAGIVRRSGMDTVLGIAQVFGIVAALAAVDYAEQAVMETRALRREERIVRLLDLIADVAEAGTGFARGHAGLLLDVPYTRLEAALDAVGEPLPKCWDLFNVDWPSYTKDTDAVDREGSALSAVELALHVAQALIRLRGEGSWVADYRVGRDRCRRHPLAEASTDSALRCPRNRGNSTRRTGRESHPRRPTSSTAVTRQPKAKAAVRWSVRPADAAVANGGELSQRRHRGRALSRWATTRRSPTRQSKESSGIYLRALAS
jgi:hypothetical protein